MKKKKVFSILSSTAIFLSLYSAPTASANSQTINELEQEKQELNQQQDNIRGNINDAEKKMESLDSERQQLSDDIAEIQTNIDNVIDQIEEQEEEIARLEEEINKLNDEIEALEDKIEKRSVALASQARRVQTSGSPENIVDVILSAESLTDLVGAMEVINLLVDNNNSVMEDQISDQKAVEEKAESVRVAKEDSAEVKQEMEINRNNLVAQRMELDNKIQIVAENYDLTSSERESLLGKQEAIAAQTSEIDGQIEEERARIAAEEKARKEREAEARRIAKAEAEAEAEAEAQRKAEREAEQKAAEQKEVQTASSSQSAAPSSSSSSNSNSSSNSSSNSNSNSNSGSSSNSNSGSSSSSNSGNSSNSNSGGWTRPASGPVTSEYGYRVHPVHGTGRLHAGIDIGGGGPITAAKSGTVVSASYHYSLGYNVLIDHGGGIRTRYGHMTSNLRVAPGQSVSAGQQIGTMGTTGTSTGVHLHFEIHQNGRPVNPRGFMGF